MNAQPDAVLCRLAARGNVSAYDAIYQRYRQPVFAFVFHMLGRASGNEDTEDITQDVFTRAFAGIRDQRVDGAFRGWLFTIARNRTSDEIRGGRQKVVSLDAEHAEPPEAPQTEQPAERAEQRAEFAWLMAAVADLPERQREALLLREMGGFSHERIAQELGASVSATKKLISRGRDGVVIAAAGAGYKRVSRKGLGHDLAMAAPIVPIAITLASLGVTGGVATGGAATGGAIAGGGAFIGGKAAATALAVLAIGGGAVAVEHDSSPSQKPQGADQREVVAGPVRTERVASQLFGGRPRTPQAIADDRGSHSTDRSEEDGSRGDRSDRDSGSEDRDSENDRGHEGRRDSGREISFDGDDRGSLESGDDSGSSSTESSSGSEDSGSDNSGPGSDGIAEPQPPPPSIGENDGSDSAVDPEIENSPSGSSNE